MSTMFIVSSSNWFPRLRRSRQDMCLDVSKKYNAFQHVPRDINREVMEDRY